MEINIKIYLRTLSYLLTPLFIKISLIKQNQNFKFNIDYLMLKFTKMSLNLFFLNKIFSFTNFKF